MAEDDQNAKSEPVKLIIVVQPINDPPTINASDQYTLVYRENQIPRKWLLFSSFFISTSLCFDSQKRERERKYSYSRN